MSDPRWLDLDDATDKHVVGARPLPLPDHVEARAVYGGPKDCYRYELEWLHSADFFDASRENALMWLMMNPSVAGHECADRTVLRCWAWTRSLGFTIMLVGNAAAYRATDQARVAETSDPVGPENSARLLAMAARSKMIIAAYGSPKVKVARRFGPDGARLLICAGYTLHALAIGANNTPKHPLYLAGNLEPTPWGGPHV